MKEKRKICKKCGTNEWYVRNDKCVECNRINTKKYYQKNKEKLIQKKKEYQAENRERVLAKKAEYRKNNKDKIAEYNKKYYYSDREAQINRSKEYRSQNRDVILKKEKEYRKKNKERRNEIKRQWVINNQARCRSHEAKRERAKGNGDGWTQKQIEKMYGYQKGKCPCCKIKLNGKYHIDHIMPLALGGLHDISNVQLLCASCNLSKHKKDPHKWAQENGLLI